MSLAETMVLRFAEDHPAEAARLLGDHPPEASAGVLARLPDTSAPSLLGRMAPPVGAACLAVLEPERGAALLRHIAPERAAALLRRVEPARREALLAALPEAARLRPLLSQPEGTAGALMDPSALALPDDLDLDEVRRRVGRHASHLALEVYLVDRDQRLRGLVDLREVLDPSRRGSVSSLLRPVEPLHAGADASAMAAHPGWIEHGSLPVVDAGRVYLGAVRQERLRSLLLGSARERRTRGGVEAVIALGELYWLGLTGLFTGFASTGAPADRAEGTS
jgi:magnesium transporter